MLVLPHAALVLTGAEICARGGETIAKTVAALPQTTLVVVGPPPPRLVVTLDGVQLECGDCADEAYWSSGGGLCDASVVWIASELYSDALLSRIGERIRGSNVRAVATLRPFPDGLEGYERLDQPEACEMSWTAALINPNKAQEEGGGAPVMIYERREG